MKIFIIIIKAGYYLNLVCKMQELQSMINKKRSSQFSTEVSFDKKSMKGFQTSFHQDSKLTKVDSNTLYQIINDFKSLSLA